MIQVEDGHVSEIDSLLVHQFLDLFFVGIQLLALLRLYCDGPWKCLTPARRVPDTMVAADFRTVFLRRFGLPNIIAPQRF